MDNFKKNQFVWIAVLFFALAFLAPLLKSGYFWLIIILGIIIFNIINKLNLNSKNMSQTIDINPALSRFVSGTKKTIAIIISFFILIILIANAVIVVDVGEVGVVSLFGKVSDNVIYSGLHLINPLARVTKMSIRTGEYTMSRTASEGKKTGDDSITALTREGLNVTLDITALYRLDAVKAADVYRTIGLDYQEKIVRPEIRSSIREVVAQYDAKDLYATKREEANQKIFDILKSALAHRNIILESLLLRDVGLPVNLTQAIQEKLAADQEAQKYDFILQKEEKEKQRKIIEAEGQRDAQKIINESLSTNYLYYSYINSLKDRQGTVYVPTNPSTGLPQFKDLGK
jgi:regulator of protease activity HflC (stomatin/prohibitin superfamily)